MFPSNAAASAPALQGWRARAWAWVLFLALFKGLIPHAALASVMMDGSPALLWCAPGAGSQVEGKPGAAMTAAAHDCVCASSADSAAPPKPAAVPTALALNAQPLRPLNSLLAVSQQRLPPARGPPAL